MPRRNTSLEARADTRGIIADAAILTVLHIHQDREFLGRKAIFIDDRSARIGCRHHLGAKLHGLLDGVLRDVARARNRDPLPFQRFAGVQQHFLGEIHRAVSGRFRADQRAAETQALAGENAVCAIGELLDHSSDETDFAATNPDIASRDIGVRSDVPE